MTSRKHLAHPLFSSVCALSWATCGVVSIWHIANGHGVLLLWWIHGWTGTKGKRLGSHSFAQRIVVWIEVVVVLCKASLRLTHLCKIATSVLLDQFLFRKLPIHRSRTTSLAQQVLAAVPGVPLLDFASFSFFSNSQFLTKWDMDWLGNGNGLWI